MLFSRHEIQFEAQFYSTTVVIAQKVCLSAAYKRLHSAYKDVLEVRIYNVQKCGLYESLMCEGRGPPLLVDTEIMGRILVVQFFRANFFIIRTLV
jgi:hypothetical protein